MDNEIKETPKSVIKPIFLLADSQILFWNDSQGPFLNRLRNLLEEAKPGKEYKAAYIGASNGDKPEYYEIFESAMKQVNITRCRMIPSNPEADDFEFLTDADIILLAGGDTRTGWDIINENGIQEKLVECYYNGAVMMGVSAGAVQLGLKGWSDRQDNDLEPADYFTTMQLVPIIVDVHDEENSWHRLGKIVAEGGQYTHGLGVPTGGAAIYHTDGAYEAVRHTLTEFFYIDEQLKQSLILPPKPDEESEKPVAAPKKKRPSKPKTSTKAKKSGARKN